MKRDRNVNPGRTVVVASGVRASGAPTPPGDWRSETETW